ncbi:MAG: NIPSNAP family protein [Cytophagales bacterium]|nr:NIPSNAP family protein [Cytophagales bacterium]
MKFLNLLVFSCAFLIAWGVQAAPKPEFYELRIYTFNSVAQQERTEAYLQNALLPALHRLGNLRVGIFKPIETDSAFGKKLYVLIPHKTLAAFESTEQVLVKDKTYRDSGKDYLDAAHTNPPYARIQTILLKAFAGMPLAAKPDLKTPAAERVYELRSYEGHTEKIYRNKVEMFNGGDEIGLFKRLGFNAVFYGEVISGNNMPNLMYLTTFENKAARDAHWKAFVDDAQWKSLSAMPEYKNNVSKIEIFFLRPTTYSDL